MIEVKDLRFTYPGSTQETIKGLNFKIEKGEIFGFLGPSGAGKSTTQKIIIGILKGYAGSVRVLDTELSSLKADYYEKIGVAFEFPNLYTKFTAIENLKFFSDLYQGETADPEELLELVGLAEHRDKQVGNFSKGMKMRLNFCRAFLNLPDIIFLDEPTSGLDPVNAKKVKDIIMGKKKEGKTIFLTTHNMTVAEDLCDRVAFIVDGSISLIDSPRNLMIGAGERKVSVEYRDNGATGKQEFSLENIGENSNFIELLKNREIETIHTHEATLEDVFIQTTGRSLS